MRDLIVQWLTEVSAPFWHSALSIDQFVTALQETSGSGRPQTFRVTARKVGGATRVDAVFMVQAGQVADADTVRGYMCRILAGAAY